MSEIAFLHFSRAYGGFRARRFMSKGLARVAIERLIVLVFIIGTLRGVRGRGVGDHTSLHRPY